MKSRVIETDGPPVVSQAWGETELVLRARGGVSGEKNQNWVSTGAARAAW